MNDLLLDHAALLLDPHNLKAHHDLPLPPANILELGERVRDDRLDAVHRHYLIHSISIPPPPGSYVCYHQNPRKRKRTVSLVNVQLPERVNLVRATAIAQADG